MMREIALSRRGLLSTGGATFALGALSAAGAAGARGVTPEARPARTLLATQFGAVGDGIADDSAALQAALDATFAPNDAGIAGMLVIPPGAYKITRTLRVRTTRNVVHHCGIVAHGARLISAIEDGKNVLEFTGAGQAIARNVLLEGLDILGCGRERHGILLEYDSNETALYNFCLRDIVAQYCGGDGCRMVGNVFEGQVINSYLRYNKGNGITFAHGFHGGILSSIHVFGSVFGDNARHGAAMMHNCYDVAFHGCYLLNNGQFGLVAENGCTLLSNCGFENNHMQAGGFDAGEAGIDLRNFGTLVGCTAYSIYHQTHLVHANVVGQLVLVGCTGLGTGPAKGAGLAKLAGSHAAGATVIGCSGAIDYVDGFEALELGGRDGGVRFGSDWQSRNLPQLGEYRMWVDKNGRLRLKKGPPSGDDDGVLVGA